jgi:hypothetical protein
MIMKFAMSLAVALRLPAGAVVASSNALGGSSLLMYPRDISGRNLSGSGWRNVE